MTNQISQFNRALKLQRVEEIKGQNIKEESTLEIIIHSITFVGVMALLLFLMIII